MALRQMMQMMPLNTFLSSTRFTPRSLGNKGQMRTTCSSLSPNNRATIHLLLVLPWMSLSGERITPRIMGPDPYANATSWWGTNQPGEPWDRGSSGLASPLTIRTTWV